MRAFTGLKIVRRVLLGVVLTGGLSGCAGYQESGLPGSSASMARNRMLWVDEERQTLGYRRLSGQAQVFQDLELFLRERGTPDFLAETTDRNRVYFILYYLEERQAYACRTRHGGGRSLEFSGPYPITDKEVETLTGIRSENGG